MKSTNDKIDEILEELLILDIKSDGAGLNYHELKCQIKQLIKETLQECIGSTETAPPKPDTMTQQEYMDYKSNMWARNQLRQDALNKLDSLLDPQED